jgi:hypothetical protein
LLVQPIGDSAERTRARGMRGGARAPAAGELPVHPLAAVFPMMDSDGLGALAEGIKENQARQGEWFSGSPYHG